MNALLRRTIFALTTVLCLTAGYALADNSLNLTRQKAEEAVVLVLQSTEVVSWCQPCGHTEKILCAVQEAMASPVPGGKWRVAINGEYVDVADIYIHQNGKWVNLAFVLGFKPKGVPNYLSL